MATSKVTSLSDSSDSSDDGKAPKSKANSSTFYNSRPIKIEVKQPKNNEDVDLDRVGNYINDSRSSSDASQPSPKKIKLEPSSMLKKEIKLDPKKYLYNDVAKKLMEKMGYKEGMGLGKHGQGRTDIVQASNQRGRRGLGRQLQGLESRPDLDWDFDDEEIIIEEKVEWLPKCTRDTPLLKEMREWQVEGQKKLEIHDETEFCDPTMLREILDGKNIFDQLEGEEMRKARTRSNPYETIRGVFFLNRAAMKMANIDTTFDFMFTSPKDENGKSLVGHNELLYFADICAGPGGFSEYVLWRKHWKAKGFGFTLRGPNDFKLEDFFAGPCETFEPFYGMNGIEGDGDVFVPENQRVFRRFVLQSTNDKGVHFVMADGGFSVEGQENIQEILSKRLYLCQCLVALYILRPGGHFVCKLFDIFTPFSVGLIYLMYHCFEHVCIHKPVTSRPANSERYLVCKWRRPNVQEVSSYFYEVNCRLQQLQGLMQTQDILEIVPLERIQEDEEFCNYIRKSNDILGDRQIMNLKKIQAFYQNATLHENRQSEVRTQCLDLWKIPDQLRSAPTRPDPASKFREIMKDEATDYCSYLATNFDQQQLNEIKSLYDYYCLVSGVKKAEKVDRMFVLGLGRSHIFKWDGTVGSKWVKMDMKLEIPKGTLFYAEAVNELQGEGKGQRKTKALHVIDAVMLGEEDVRHLPYKERMTRVEMFVHAISKPSRTDFATIRAKKIYRLDKVENIFENFHFRQVKGIGQVPRICYQCDETKFYIPQGILFLKVIEEPWSSVLSKTSQKIYFYNYRNKSSTYELQAKVSSPFKSSFSKRILWSWDNGAEAYVRDNSDGKGLCKKDLLDFIHAKKNA